MTHRNAILAALFSAALIPTAASAAPVTQQVKVYYGDLDLSSRSGQNELQARLNSAADLACGRQPDLRDMAAEAHYRSCMDAAVAQALDDVHVQYAERMRNQDMREASRGR